MKVRYLFMILAGLVAGHPAFSMDAQTSLTGKTHPAVIGVEQTAEYAKEWWMPRHHAILERNRAIQPEIVFIGDSITHGWENTGRKTWDQYYKSRNAANLGFGGDKTQHLLWRIDHGELDGIHPRLVVLMIGTNNSWDGDPVQTLDGIEEVCLKSRAKLPETEILLLAIFPRGDSEERSKVNNAVNERLPELADALHIHYLDINEHFLGEDGIRKDLYNADGVHPAEAGYRIWAEAMEPTIKQLLKEDCKTRTAITDYSREFPRPIVGAIRWDAWTGGEITDQVERSLGPKKYHDRLPWFAEVIGDGTVRIDGGRQEVMDREIDWAASAGLDYWAFLVYQKGYDMSVALEQYFRSEKRDRINFCMVLHGTLGCADGEWPAERDRAVALLREPGYQTVLGGRPLVYAFVENDFRFDRFSEFVESAESQGLDPYCVFMGWNPPVDSETAKDKGFAAVSAYAMGGSQTNFTELAAAVERSYWGRAVEAGAPYIPLVTTGWDKSPRKDNPVSWEIGQDYHQQEVFPSQATPEEIAAHLVDGLAFVEKHDDLCAAHTLIIYAWNEYDEGGWIAPTRSEDGTPDTRRLDAIKGVLKR